MGKLILMEIPLSMIQTKKIGKEDVSMATGYICSYCKRHSGATVSVFDGKRTEKPAMSTRNCPVSPSGQHKWVKK